MHANVNGTVRIFDPKTQTVIGGRAGNYWFDPSVFSYSEFQADGFDLDKEGTLPVFVLPVKDDNGNVSQRKYKMNTPIVRRVLAVGEAKEPSAPKRKTRHH